MPVILRTTTVKLKENLYVGDGKYASVAYEHKPGRRLVSGGGVRVVAVLSVTLLVSAAVSKRDGRILATVLPIGVAAVSGMIGYVVAWLLSDVFVVFGVGLGSCDGLGGGWFRHRWFRHRAYRVEQGHDARGRGYLDRIRDTGRGDRHRPIVRRIRHHRLAVRRGFLQPSRSDRTGQTQGPHHRRTSGANRPPTAQSAIFRRTEPSTKSTFRPRNRSLKHAKPSSTCLRRHWPTRNASRPCRSSSC